MMARVPNPDRGLRVRQRRLRQTQTCCPNARYRNDLLTYNDAKLASLIHVTRQDFAISRCPSGFQIEDRQTYGKFDKRDGCVINNHGNQE